MFFIVYVLLSCEYFYDFLANQNVHPHFSHFKNKKQYIYRYNILTQDIT